MAHLFAVVLLVLAQAIGPAAAPKPSKLAIWLDPDRTEPAGTRYATFPSKLADSEVSYLIYLPPDYETSRQRRYPVVYWLHGMGGLQRKGAPFVAALDAQIRAGAAPPMIAVLVNGTLNSFFCDTKDGRPVESVIIKEMISHIDRTYRTIAGREARAVEGYSMGGYGAAHLGFKYPEVFGLVGVMAGGLVSGPQLAARAPDTFNTVFGGDLAFFQANDPFTLLRQNADRIRGRTAIRVSVGDQDSFQPHNEKLHDLLVHLNIQHEYVVVPGVGHDRDHFYKELGGNAFAWYQKAFASFN